MADSDTQAEHLLELELDGRADFGELVRKVLCVGDGRRELSSYKGDRTFDPMNRQNWMLKSAYPLRDRDQEDGESA